MQISLITEEQKAYLAVLKDMNSSEKNILLQREKINSLTQKEEHEKDSCDNDND